jgi:hypothetical protein
VSKSRQFFAPAKRLARTPAEATDKIVESACVASYLMGLLKQRSKRTNEKSNQLKLSSTSLWALQSLGLWVCLGESTRMS